MLKVRWLDGIVVTGTIMSLALTGCAYRLYPPSLPFRNTFIVVAKSPEKYTIHVHDKDYAVAADGKVTFDYPAVRRGCGVYLFNLVPINRGTDPFKEQTISITKGPKVSKSFSLDDISKWPLDSSGYHVLNLKSS